MYIHLYSGNYSPETDDKRELNRKKEDTSTDRRYLKSKSNLGIITTKHDLDQWIHKRKLQI